MAAALRSHELLRLRRKVLFALNLLRKKFLSGKFMKENSKG